ncbi:MAG: SRPBCC domain-containing protein [Leptolyngbya sp. SIOISBB]|nr:SRPBCC domain-containing protein [Leptolyngbya sp. SIOISBB]
MPWPLTKMSKTTVWRQRLALMPGWSTEIVIDAPRSHVWEQVTNFRAYADWNPFVIEAQADFEIGKTIRFLEDLKQFEQHWIEATFLTIEPPHSFAWQGHFAAPYLFTVRHRFELTALGEHQTRFRQTHQNSGLLVPFLALQGIYSVSHQGYLDFDQALKTRCETVGSQMEVDHA